MYIAIGTLAWAKSIDKNIAIKNMKKEIPRYIKNANKYVVFQVADEGAYVDGMGGICAITGSSVVEVERKG
jgi:hypothetical protein